MSEALLPSSVDTNEVALVASVPVSEEVFVCLILFKKKI